MAGRRRKRRRRRRRSRRGSGFGLRRALPYLLAVALLLGGGTIFALRAEVTGGEPEALCALVIDRSNSSDSDVTTERYQELGQKAVQGCRNEGARLSIYHFGQSGPGLVLLNDEPFDLFLPEGRTQAKQEAELEDTAEKAKEAVTEVFEVPSGEDAGSDILAAVDGVATNLQQQATVDELERRFLILLTDGIQVSGDISVEALGDEDADVDRLVAQAEEVGLMPDLNGVQVSFVGVRAGASRTGGQYPHWFEDKVEDFWREIVQTGGGKVCTYVVDSQILPVSC